MMFYLLNILVEKKVAPMVNQNSVGILLSYVKLLIYILFCFGGFYKVHIQMYVLKKGKEVHIFIKCVSKYSP